ncbi:MAG: HEPN domain-containing protein [Candidatus Poribacteria bacterium]
MKNNMAEARRWFLQGSQDLDDAIFNLSGNRYNVACFLAQQSAEKILKAYLIAQGVESVWGHSTWELCKIAKGIDKDFARVENEARSLEKYYIPTRYPDALPGAIPSEAFDENDAKSAISMTSKIIELVQSKLNITS